MTAPTGSASQWTYADYARLPDDGNRYEVIDGEVCVTPAPGVRHQRVAGNLFVLLREYVMEHDIGEMIRDVDVLFVEGHFLRPDMVYVPRDARLEERGVYSAPGLVVEVLSPGSRRIDRVKKPPRYRAFGVPEYWIVDPEHERIEVDRFAAKPAKPAGTGDAESAGDPAPELCDRVLRWQPDPATPALELPVPAVFRRPST